MIDWAVAVAVFVGFPAYCFVVFVTAKLWGYGTAAGSDRFRRDRPGDT